MASITSSTGVNSSSTSSSGIDVPTVVSQLMSVAKQPLDKLNKKITQSGLIVSDLGSLKSKLTNLQTALISLESPNTYLSAAAVSSNTSVATVSTSSGAPLGRYNLEVSQTAESSNFSISGFTSISQTVTLDGPGFNLRIGTGGQAVTYNSGTNYDATTTPKTTGGSLVAIDSNTSTLTDLNRWINTLYSNFGVNVSSSIVQTTSGNYSLLISGTQTGLNNAIQFSGLNGTAVTTTTANASTTNSIGTNNGGYTVSVNSKARDSIVAINGLSVQRTTNIISDVIKNTTFSLTNQVLPEVNPKPTTLINVSQGTDNTSATVQAFITAYNAMVTQYKSMIANSVNTPGTTTQGSLAQNPTMLSFVESIKKALSSGALTATKSSISMKSLGMDYQSDGTLKFNSTNLTASQSAGLSATLSAGISVGGSENSSNNLYTYLSSITNPGGMIDSTISIQNQNVQYSNQRVKALNSQLATLENNYYSQYSKLNSLLFTLNQTSSQLTSSLTAITNINKGTS